MIEEIGYKAACSNCLGDLGLVYESGPDQDIAISNADMTAYVVEEECDKCGTTVFRAKRMLRVVIRV